MMFKRISIIVILNFYSNNKDKKGITQQREGVVNQKIIPVPCSLKSFKDVIIYYKNLFRCYSSPFLSTIYNPLPKS